MVHFAWKENATETIKYFVKVITYELSLLQYRSTWWTST
jgi:hypothetical protein